MSVAVRRLCQNSDPLRSLEAVCGLLNMARGQEKNGKAQSSAASSGIVPRGGREQKKSTKNGANAFKPPAHLQGKESLNERHQGELTQQGYRHGERPACNVPRVDYRHDGVAATRSTPDPSPHNSPQKRPSRHGNKEEAGQHKRHQNDRDGEERRLPEEGAADREDERQDGAEDQYDEEWHEHFKAVFEKEHQGDDVPWEDEKGKENYFTQWMDESTLNNRKNGKKAMMMRPLQSFQ